MHFFTQKMQVRSFFVINMYREPINELIKWKNSDKIINLPLYAANML